MPGSLVEAIGYAGFFVLTTLLGVPVLALVWWAERRLKIKQTAARCRHRERIDTMLAG